ncbi:hypothetical protein L2Z40_18710 (plasmid) [Acinetobacter baumannii]|nr:hypothetical protein [Acinetobacter baumannii]UVU36982.1 hypothetical protein L2Z40_18710 [Acinetobacter baumannii]
MILLNRLRVKIIRLKSEQFLHSPNENSLDKNTHPETLRAIEELENSKAVDSFKVYDRVGKEIYSNMRNDEGVWNQKAGLNIYNQETNKTLSKTEADYNLLTQQQLKRN